MPDQGFFLTLSGAVAAYQVALLLALANPAGTFVYVISRLDR